MGVLRRLICAATHVRMKEYAAVPWPDCCARCRHWYGAGTLEGVSVRDQIAARRQQWRDQAVGWAVLCASAPIWLGLFLLSRSIDLRDP